MLSREIERSDDRTLVIGIVNNLPPAAARATLRRFRSLLTLASAGRDLRLRVFTLPRGPVQEAGRGRRNEGLDDLLDSALDGLIVTGAEPRAAAIVDEPCWPALARIVDWADRNTTSSIWSCMAAHAAVRRLDGLDRFRLPAKLSGVFECQKVPGHHLVDDAPARWRVPHSRYNTVDEEVLRQSGYTILSRSPRVGVDMFVKQRRSLFLFLQGHPEYTAGSLPQEYRRDVRRFLLGEQGHFPETPEGCFAETTLGALGALRTRALVRPHPELLSELDAAITARPLNRWRGQAVALHARWLSCLAERKSTNAVSMPRPVCSVLVHS